MPPTVRASGPFRDVAPSLVIAFTYLFAVIVWLLFGSVLPGGRWLAVHLFTIGFLSTVILGFTHHFATTLTHAKTTRPRAIPLLFHAGNLTVLYAIPTGNRMLVIIGSTAITVAVFFAYWTLRGLRKNALGARLGWIVRIYERAHGAFLHGALLGALTGATLVTGPLWGSMRLAHLHANVLGWAGLTLAATLVFFGPTLTYTRIRDGADHRAAARLRRAATALTVGLIFLIATGVSQTTHTLSRFAAAASLAVFAYLMIRVLADVALAVVAAKPNPQKPLVLTVCVTFAVVLVGDVAIVAWARWWLIDTLGVLMFTGVLLPSVLATVMYVSPFLTAHTHEARAQRRERFVVGQKTRAAVVTIGGLMVVADTARIPIAWPFAETGFALIGVSVFATVLTAIWPARSPRRAPVAPS